MKKHEMIKYSDIIGESIVRSTFLAFSSGFLSIQKVHLPPPRQHRALLKSVPALQVSQPEARLNPGEYLSRDLKLTTVFCIQFDRA